MVLLGIAQALLNLPGDIWDFTEVYGKAGWDIVKAKICVFPQNQLIFFICHKKIAVFI